MSIIQSNTTQLRFNIGQMKKLIAADLGKKEDDIDVRFIVQNTADDRFNSSAHYEVTDVEVTFKK